MTTKNLDRAPIVSMHLIVDEQNVTTSSDACVIRFSSPPDPTDLQVMRLIEHSGVLDFWSDENEDGYSSDDGEQI